MEELTQRVNSLKKTWHKMKDLLGHSKFNRILRSSNWFKSYETSLDLVDFA